MKHDPDRREATTRDVLARAIMLEILEGRGTPEGGVWLEPDPEFAAHFHQERPMYTKRILENYGKRAAMFQEPFQVMPSALYTTGGIRIDEWGRTTVPRLYAPARSPVAYTAPTALVPIPCRIYRCSAVAPGSQPVAKRCHQAALISMRPSGGPSRGPVNSNARSPVMTVSHRRRSSAVCRNSRRQMSA